MSINSWEILPSEFPQALDIDPCLREKFCNNYEVMHMSGRIFNADENVEDKDEYGFTCLFFQKSPIIIDENTKMQLMKI